MKKKGTWSFYDIPLTKETLFNALYVIAIIVAVFILYIFILDNFENEVYSVSFSMIFLGFCAYVHHKQKLDYKQNLYRKIAWIAEKTHGNDWSPFLRDFELVDYIEHEQRNQNTFEHLRINFSNKTEKEHLEQMLKSHKEYVVEQYFQNRLKESKDIYNLQSLEYYFFSLYCFVNNNFYGYEIEEKLYNKREDISERQYKRQLKEYGRVYYKLCLITQLYIENNENVQKLFDYVNKEIKNNIIEILEKNETCFYR